VVSGRVELFGRGDKQGVPRCACPVQRLINRRWLTRGDGVRRFGRFRTSGTRNGSMKKNLMNLYSR
jgi:hypothetical protein